MTHALNIGVDFGSTGLRAAYVTDENGPNEEPVVQPVTAGDGVPWLLCEPADGGRAGMAFPSLKSKLGTVSAVTWDGRSSPPAELVTAAFRALKSAVESRTARPVAQAAVTVPARYSASQRAALREAVMAAGFADAHPVNDSVAAVIAHMGRRDLGATVLVYGMGYSGFEIGLVRAVRGHFRALGYEGGRAPAGLYLDQLILEALLDAVARSGLVLDAHRWNPTTWLRVRTAAQRVKEHLSAHERAAFPVTIRDQDGRSLGVVEVRRADFERVVGPSFTSTLENAPGLLEQAGMTPEDLDEVLLVGGSTLIPLLRARVEDTLGRKPLALDRSDLARGAALYASRLAAKPVPASPELEKSAEAAEVELPAGHGALEAAVSAADEVAAEPDAEHLVLRASEPHENRLPASPTLEEARRLLDEGRREEARTFLRTLVDEARALLESIPEAGVAVPSAPSSAQVLARRALARAQQYLDQGQFEKAVGESHVAWREDHDDPDVFETMIDIHCRAATAAETPGGYADAQRWLMCAYSHDESNSRIRQLLAERHFLQARYLNGRGKRKQALEILENCLNWDPEHSPARELQETLTRR